ELFRFRPDCLFLLNGPSASTLQYLGFSAGMETGIPSRRLTWYVDDPNYLATREGNWACYQKDDVAVADRTYVTAFSRPQPRSLFHLPPAAMLESKGRFDPDLHFPILYVGSIMNLQETLSHLPMAVQTLIQDIVRAREAKKEVSFLAWMHEMNPHAQKQKELAEIAQRIVQERTAKRFPHPEQYVDYFFYLVATFYKRWNVVKTLLPLGLHVFGPNDWIPLLGDAYRDRHHGILDASELADAYASAKININLHSLQCPTSLNIRDFDIPRAGGFLLTDWVEDLEGGYVNHKEHVCAVANCEEFAAQADYYLAHENERGEIAQTGCDWVANHHTFRHRAQAVLHRLQGGLA
ncbi:glycosyltransferase, partial [bacterium]|nr:glycosyltransferase [bacterium]